MHFSSLSIPNQFAQHQMGLAASLLTHNQKARVSHAPRSDTSNAKMLVVISCLIDHAKIEIASLHKAVGSGGFRLCCNLHFR